MKKNMVSNPVIARLPRYYRCLQELDAMGCVRVSSGTLADRLGLTASQIRQDFSCFGEFGQQGYGYNVKSLLYEISEILGVNGRNTAVVIGCGNLGRAITGHLDFAACGFRLLGAFDADPELVGRRLGKLTITSVSELESFVKEHHPDIAVLTLPGEYAQQLADDLVSWGVTTFWNLAGREILFSNSAIKVESVFLLDSLMTLSYKLKEDN